jgi:hypothetical protein
VLYAVKSPKTSRGPCEMPTLFSPQPRRGHSGRVMRASSGRERRVTVHDIQRLCDMPASKPDGLNAIKLHAMAHPTCIRQDLSHVFMHGMLTLPCCARVSRPLADRFSRTVIDAAATQQRPTQWQQQQQHAITQQQLQQEQHNTSNSSSSSSGTQQDGAKATATTAKATQRCFRDNGVDSPPKMAL